LDRGLCDAPTVDLGLARSPKNIRNANPDHKPKYRSGNSIRESHHG
jgi:hypothetical protein